MRGGHHQAAGLSPKKIAGHREALREFKEAYEEYIRAGPSEASETHWAVTRAIPAAQRALDTVDTDLAVAPPGGAGPARRGLENLAFLHELPGFRPIGPGPPIYESVLDMVELVVALIHPTHRPMFELLAATGVRRSELIAFRVGDLHLDGAQPRVQVRQRAVRRTGAGMVVGALKSRYARRELPIPLDLADRLAAHVAGRPREALAFGSDGGPYDTHHLHQRVLVPACAEAGVEWAGFHTFRHTVASRLFAEGRNVVQVQRWLGHHSPSFTLDTYVHLLDGDLGDPLEALGGNTGATDCPETAANAVTAELVNIGQ